MGADVANGFTYIMEVMPKGKREVMANRWQFMFALGIIVAILLVTGLVALDVHPDMLWRIVLAVPAIPACMLLFMRRELPETPAWFVERGRFIEAKQASREYYGEQDGKLLDDILPNENVQIPHPTLKETLHDLFRRPFYPPHDPVRLVLCAVQSFENYAFSFYLPLILVTIGISGQIQNNLALLVVNCIAALSAFVGPLLLPKLGHKGLSKWGFLLVAIGISISSWGVYSSSFGFITFGAALMLWGHYWDSGKRDDCHFAGSENRVIAVWFPVSVITIVKVTAFITTLVFPPLFEKLGVPLASLIIAIAPFCAFLASIFLLPEVFRSCRGR